MSDKTATGGMSITDNAHVKELFATLKEAGKDTSGLTAMVNYCKGMEDFVSRAQSQMTSMQSKIDKLEEIQKHPVKYVLGNTVESLRSQVEEIKEGLSELKANIVEGCKNALTAFKEKGIVALSKIASFFRIKGGLEAMKNQTVKSINECDKSLANIHKFATEYHETGLHLKNMARIAVGKPTVDKAKEPGRIAKVVSAPIRAHKACMEGIRKQITKMISALDRLDKSAETIRGKAAEKPQKAPLMTRLTEKKNAIKAAEVNNPAPIRAAKAQGHGL